MKRVSVAMATYNGATYIERQLHSIIAQSRLPDEVVISDDCSTDNTVGLVQRFIGEYNLVNWRLIVNNENIGFVGNFRRALRNIDADIVFLCDQDDLWHEDKVRNMVGVLEQESTILGLSSSFAIINVKDNTVNSRWLYLKSNHGLVHKLVRQHMKLSLKLVDVLYSNPAPGCTSAFRRQVVEEYLTTPESKELPHDWAMVLLSAKEGEYVFLNEELTLYRLHGANTIGLERRRESLISRREAIETHCLQFHAIARLLPLNGYMPYIDRLIALYTHRVNTMHSRSIMHWLRGLAKLRRVSKKRCLGSYLLDLVFIIKDFL